MPFHQEEVLCAHDQVGLPDLFSKSQSGGRQVKVSADIGKQFLK
jgi:hypothetical protein